MLMFMSFNKFINSRAAKFLSAVSLLLASIGVATALPDDEVRPRDLISWSDRVLYEAKLAGRNQVRQHRQ